jgi:hypothetical protein
MESQKPITSSEQVEIIRATQEAAARASSTPFWYWLGTGALMGFAVFAVSIGTAIVCTSAVILILLGGRALNWGLATTRGIRIGRVGGGAANWLVWPWFGLLIALAIVGRVVTANVEQIWVGALAAVVAVIITVAFGYGYDRIRLSAHP